MMFALWTAVTFGGRSARVVERELTIRRVPVIEIGLMEMPASSWRERAAVHLDPVDQLEHLRGALSYSMPA